MFNLPGQSLDFPLLELALAVQVCLFCECILELFVNPPDGPLLVFNLSLLAHQPVHGTLLVVLENVCLGLEHLDHLVLLLVIEHEPVKLVLEVLAPAECVVELVLFEHEDGLVLHVPLVHGLLVDLALQLFVDSRFLQRQLLHASEVLAVQLVEFLLVKLDLVLHGPILHVLLVDQVAKLSAQVLQGSCRGVTDVLLVCDVPDLNAKLFVLLFNVFNYGFARRHEI